MQELSRTKTGGKMRKNSDIVRECAFFMYNLKLLRKQHNLSKKKMAESLGIGLWSMNKLERGEIPPKLSANIFLAVYKRFGISPSVLISCRLDEEG